MYFVVYNIMHSTLKKYDNWSWKMNASADTSLKV